ncbi:unnamed protein product [Closterium sp. NIES-53]
MAPGQQASAVDMAVEGAEDEGEADLAATTSMEAAGVVDTAATRRATDAVVADSTASATIVPRADIFGAIASSSLMDGPLLKAKMVEEQEEGEEEDMEAVAVAEVVLQPSPVKHVTSALGQRAEVKGMGKAMFKGADEKMVGIKNVLWVPNLAANLISVWRLQKAGMDTNSKGAKTYTARIGERILWDLHEDRDVYNEMWQIPVANSLVSRINFETLRGWGQCGTVPHHSRAAPAATAVSPATAATAATASTAAMASLNVLTFDAEGLTVDLDLWWTTRDAVARLAIRSHLPSVERAHFGQYKTAKSFYNTVVARYSSPSIAALSRLILPYLFLDLATFATVTDLITHLRTSDARYRAALPTEFCAKNPPPVHHPLLPSHPPP